MTDTNYDPNSVESLLVKFLGGLVAPADTEIGYLPKVVQTINGPNFGYKHAWDLGVLLGAPLAGVPFNGGGWQSQVVAGAGSLQPILAPYPANAMHLVEGLMLAKISSTNVQISWFDCLQIKDSTGAYAAGVSETKMRILNTGNGTSHTRLFTPTVTSNDTTGLTLIFSGANGVHTQRAMIYRIVALQ